MKTSNVKIPVGKSPPVPTTKRGRQSTGSSTGNPSKVLKETANQVPKKPEPIEIEDEDDDDEDDDDGLPDAAPKPKPLKTIPLDPQSSAALTMVEMMRIFTGSTADETEFVEHCRSKMAIERCDEAQLLTVEQAGTTLWHKLRVGRITASRIHQASRCKVSHGSLHNSIMGMSSGGFSFAMDRGTRLEDGVFNVVRNEYPGLQKSGLLLNSQYPYFGASPDGIHDDFVLEIKCPLNRNTHADYVTPGRLKKQYVAQIQMQMRLADKRKALLAVADPSFERNKKITKVWIAYDQEYTENLMEDAYNFWVQSIFSTLKRHQPKTAG
jgi:putative phage-type endonuclease